MTSPRLRALGPLFVGALASAVSTGCLSGRSVGATPTTARHDPVTTSAAPPPPTAPPTTKAPSTTTPPSTATATTLPPGPPYRLGQIVLPLVDTSRPTISHGQEVSPSRSLPTTVWYPDRPGRWPLLVFAHGFQVGPEPYTSLLETWASHGYIVAAPSFPLTDAARAGSELDENDINNQPADVRFVTDQLVAPSSPVAARIDPGRVAVAGHSDGAETALAASTDGVPAGEPPYRAVIVMSGQPVDGAAGRNPPALVVQGDADDTNPPPLGYSTWDQAASPKYLLVLQGAGHLPPFEAGSAWLPGVERVTEEFLDAFVARTAPVGSVAASASG
ncbi:MAG TPA: hypothetical protein VFH58_14410, partial [Acidimicrobiales bacterium]|nr:hypothetical protein [Acidimicrobiales bacterium]